VNEIQKKLKMLQSVTEKTQVQLARDFGVTILAFSNWWNGKSIPRQKALRLINKELSLYGIENKIENFSETNALKQAVCKLNKKNKNILKTIISRPDLIDELSLQITYNSNALEGSTLTRVDTKNVIFEKKVLGNKTLVEQLEAKNHDKAFRYLLENLMVKKQINEQLIKKLHEILLAGIHENAGKYRNHGVRIVGSYVPTANYVKVPELMKKLFLKKQKGDIMEFISRFHADFEKIHPFADGNGRIGRLLLIGMLLQKNMAPAIVVKKKRPEYYKCLQQAQLHDNFEILEIFITEAVLKGYKIISD
jgi:Fic family protein